MTPLGGPYGQVSRIGLRELYLEPLVFDHTKQVLANTNFKDKMISFPKRNVHIWSRLISVLGWVKITELTGWICLSNLAALPEAQKGPGRGKVES